MLIEKVYPAIIKEKDYLLSRLISKADSCGLTSAEIDTIFSSMPNLLLGAGCFLDAMTGLWRYEFGFPAILDKTKKMLWGTTMWLPVDILYEVLLCAYERLKTDQFIGYLKKLANPDKHRDALIEMMPILRSDKNISMDFEVSGHGQGNTNVDWKIGPVAGRHILLDAKNRVSDLYAMADQEEMDAPQHDCSLLFRSIENKLNAADPDTFLQGIWVNTQVKQEIKNLTKAFNDLENDKVHFFILGDERKDAFIFARRPIDIEFLKEVLNIEMSDRFTFSDENIEAENGMI